MQPVAVRSAAFCVVCSLLRFVSLSSGCQAVCAYVSMGLMYCLYTVVICSLECPYVVCVSALSTLSLDSAFVFMFSECFLKVAMGSRVTPRRVGFGFTGIGVLKRVTSGCALICVFCVGKNCSSPRAVPSCAADSCGGSEGYI